jgi:enoyl-CoA hydratase/carnithine racemase
MEMILSGRLHKGKEALDLGLVHQVAPNDQLSEAVKKTLDTVFRNPQYALSLAKRAVYASQDGTLEAGLREESHAFSQCFSNDFFSNLMVKQLREGTLTTTSDLPEWCHKKGGEGA